MEMPPGGLLLEPHQVSAHLGHRAHGGRGHGGLRRANGLGHVLALQQHVLRAVHELHLHVQAVHAAGDFLPILQQVLPEEVQAHRAVHRAGVQIHCAERLGGSTGDGGFARARGAVDGDGKYFLHTSPPDQAMLPLASSAMAWAKMRVACIMRSMSMYSSAMWQQSSWPGNTTPKATVLGIMRE